jgi:hypothetical protein
MTEDKAERKAEGFRISVPALLEVRAGLRAYYAVLEASELSESSRATYMDMANNFVRWLAGDFVPGSRNAPYSIKRKYPIAS